MNLSDKNSRRFLRESNCGYEDGTVFVCCGSAVNFKNTDEARSAIFQANPLVPTEQCGIKVKNLLILFKKDKVKNMTRLVFLI